MVGAVRTHCVDDVGHGDDARFCDDPVAREAHRIAAAIHPLVMLLDRPGDRPGEIDFRHEGPAERGVPTDQGNFFRREGPGLAEHRERHRDLAGIVQRRRETQPSIWSAPMPILSPILYDNAATRRL